jgi:hypothetical protein
LTKLICGFFNMAKVVDELDCDSRSHYNYRPLNWRTIAEEFRDAGRSNTKRKDLFDTYTEVFKYYVSGGSRSKAVSRWIKDLEEVSSDPNYLPLCETSASYGTWGREVDVITYKQVLQKVARGEAVNMISVIDILRNELQNAHDLNKSIPVTVKTEKKWDGKLVTFQVLIQRLDNLNDNALMHAIGRFCGRWNLPLEIARKQLYKPDRIPQLLKPNLTFLEQHCIYRDLRQNSIDSHQETRGLHEKDDINNGREKKKACVSSGKGLRDSDATLKVAILAFHY